MKAARRLLLICALLCLVGTILSGCARTPPDPILPEELLKKSDIPMLEQKCYELLLDGIGTYIEKSNAFYRGGKKLSAEDATVDMTFLPYVYSFYKKTDDGQYDSYLAIACSVDSSLVGVGEFSSYNFLLLRNPRRGKTTGTLHADEFSLEYEIPLFQVAQGWEYQEAGFISSCCTDEQTIVVSEYGTGEVIRKYYDKDAVTEYLLTGER